MVKGDKITIPEIKSPILKELINPLRDLLNQTSVKGIFPGFSFHTSGNPGMKIKNYDDSQNLLSISCHTNNGGQEIQISIDETNLNIVKEYIENGINPTYFTNNKKNKSSKKIRNNLVNKIYATLTENSKQYGIYGLNSTEIFSNEDENYLLLKDIKVIQEPLNWEDLGYVGSEIIASNMELSLINIFNNLDPKSKYQSKEEQLSKEKSIFKILKSKNNPILTLEATLNECKLIANNSEIGKYRVLEFFHAFERYLKN